MRREQGSNWPELSAGVHSLESGTDRGTFWQGLRQGPSALAVSDSEHKEISQRGVAGLAPSNLLRAVSHLLWSGFYFFLCNS